MKISGHSSGVFLAMIVASAFCLLPFKTLAGDYKVDYAIDVHGVAESGETSECSYGRSCRLEFRESHIYVYLIFNGASNKRFSVTIHGRDDACCYFSDGDTSKMFIENRQINKLKVFEGRRRRGNEFVRNEPIGTLFLAFKDVH